MAGSMGRPLIQTTLQDAFTVVDRRLSQIDARERGSGRSDWLPVAKDYNVGLTAMDGAVPSWRVLNDGRVELRGRLSIPDGTSVVNGQVIMCISLWYYPYPDDYPDEALREKRYQLPRAQPPLDSSVSISLPCSSAGANPGMIRADVVGANREPVTIGPDTAYVIARPPESQPLTGWVGFDHAIYDPYLYIDVIAPVSSPSRESVFGPQDYGVAIFPQGATNRVAVPGEIPMEWMRPRPSEETQ